MKKIKERYIHAFSNRDFFMPAVFSFLILCASLILNFFAEMYATEKVSNSVTDIILSNTRAFDVDGMFVYGGFCLVVLIGIMAFLHPKKIPFMFKSISLFTLVRSVFITLTHIGPFPIVAVIKPSMNIVSYFSLGGDLFFSGHTGLPFLMALLFWNYKHVRYFFLALSVFFGTIVLMGHFHYSIDVLSAFFITFTVYHMALFFFKKDKQMFDSEH